MGIQAILGVLALVADPAWWGDRAVVTVTVAVAALPLLPLVILAQAPSLLAGVIFVGVISQAFLARSDAGLLATLFPLSDLLLCWLSAQLGIAAVCLLRGGSEANGNSRMGFIAPDIHQPLPGQRLLSGRKEGRMARLRHARSHRVRGRTRVARDLPLWPKR
jgi:hypothetical protein